MSAPRWFVRGDADGFFALALDNLVQLLVIVGLCGGVLGFGPDLLYGRVLPGAAVSILVGNAFYAWQARRLAAVGGRDDVTALPYGINTVSLFAFVFLVMLPAKLAAVSAGAAPAQAATIAWRAGLAACFGSALIEIVGAFGAERIRRATPRAALLSSLAGIAVSFIALGFLFKSYGAPLVGVVTLVVVLAAYFGNARMPGGVPGGLAAVVLGTVLAWVSGLVQSDPVAWEAARSSLGLRLPVPVVGELFAALTSGELLAYVSVIIPMGVVNVIGSLQNIESAEAAGDAFDTRSSLLANGVGSLVAALFGSCFPTTIYIGHPGWKSMGARLGYSLANGAFMTLICTTGSVALLALAVPIEAGAAIVLWIGIIIIAQAFEATPSRHATAVAVGLLPGVAAWGALMIKTGARAAAAAGGTGLSGGAPLEAALAAMDVSARGAFALEQGFIFTAMILAAATAEIIDGRMRRAALWMSAGAGLAWFGLIHGYRWVGSDTVVNMGWGTGAPWALAYAVAALVLVSLPGKRAD